MKIFNINDFLVLFIMLQNVLKCLLFVNISKRFGVFSWIMMKYAIKVKSLTTKISDSYGHEINSWPKKYLFSTNYKLHNESLKDLKSKSLRFTLVIYNIKNCVKALSWRHNTNPKIQAALPLCKVGSWNTKV